MIKLLKLIRAVAIFLVFIDAWTALFHENYAKAQVFALLAIAFVLYEDNPFPL